MSIFTNLRNKVVDRASRLEDDPVPSANWADKVARKSRGNSVQIKNEILDYLKQSEGEFVKTAEISQLLGYKNSSSVSTLLTELKKSGAIKVLDGTTVKGFKYQVNRTRVNKSKAKRVSTVEPKVKLPSGRTKRKEYVFDGKERVLRYLANHQGEFLSNVRIGQATGVPEASVSRYTVQLVDEKRIERSTPTSEGTRYRVPGNVNVPDAKDSPNVPKPPKAPVPVKIEPNNDAKLLGVLEPLMWDFIKSTRSTDILVFLTWLEQRKG